MVEATVGGKLVSSDPVTATTGALPDSLAMYSVAITPGSGAPSPGYYIVSGAGHASFAFNEKGEIRWYRDFGQTTEEVKMQYDGSFTTYVGANVGSTSAVGQFIRYSPDGTQLAVYTPDADATEPDGLTLYTDPHELLITVGADGKERLNWYSIGIRTVSETDSTPAAWHELIRQTTDGDVELRWKAWGAHDATEQLEMGGADRDIDHPNALAVDPTDGNYVASFRNLDALIKIDAKTGDELWQLGGTESEFTIVGDPLNGFYGQHSIRVLDNGHLLIYDNGLHHPAPESRAVEYALDTQAMTATMVWQFRHTPPISTTIVGSVERLQNGNTLVAFALNGVVDEVDPSGNLVWEAQLNNAAMVLNTYRIRRLPSLYQFQKP